MSRIDRSITGILLVCVVSLVLFYLSANNGENGMPEGIEPRYSQEIAPEDLAGFQPVGKFRDEQVYGDYTVRVYNSKPHGPYADDTGNYGSSIEIIRNGERIYAWCTAYRTTIYSIFKGEENGLGKINGRDLTGNGQPNLVLELDSGGSICCRDFYVYEIGEEFKFLKMIKKEREPLGSSDIDKLRRQAGKGS